eukprot:TRINITY_DN6966_c0_g1_i2.p1 TRINITY_DN6966_c0_g1~~TRINITY_DN6966_c0_g1_i2.p1  ORF type:complete len:275 (+),score=52.00 TRINITY_DN6966_c0_g1_i2:86-826(+)
MNSNVFTLLTVAVLVTTTAAMVSPIPNSDSGSTKFSIMHLTDVHGWINGHPHNETLNTDFGHLASFLSHMKAKAEADKSEFFLFDSGDLIEGTGLSDATPVHGTNIFKITEQLEQSYDGMTIGNHDIGHPETVELMQQKNGFIDAMKGKYLTSNAFDKKTQDPLGNFYRVIDSAQGHRILVLGFIFNFDQNANNTGEFFLQVLVPQEHSVFFSFPKNSCQTQMALSRHQQAIKTYKTIPTPTIITI